jgi:transcription initiation factor TFIID TATA-box-binding protein
MPRTRAIINIQNVVASATLNQKVDLNAVVKSFPGVEYRPEQFPGLVFRIKRPKTATLIFNSGKMVCTGAKSEKEARRAVMTVVKELKKGGIIIISKLEFKVQNIVASVSLGGKIELEQAVSKLVKTM